MPAVRERALTRMSVEDTDLISYYCRPIGGPLTSLRIWTERRRQPSRFARQVKSGRTIWSAAHRLGRTIDTNTAQRQKPQTTSRPPRELQCLSPPSAHFF